MPKAIVEENGLSQISDPAQSRPLIDECWRPTTEELAAYRCARKKLQGFFCRTNDEAQRVGGVDPKLTIQLLSKKLKPTYGAGK